MQDLSTASAREWGWGKEKIEKAVPVFFLSLCAHSYVLASLACCQIFDKKGRKMSLDR